MKTILIHNLNGNFNRMFDPNERDGYNDPFIYLRERLYQIGYLLKTSDNNSLENCEWVLFFDYYSVKPYFGFRGKIRKVKEKILRRTHNRDLYSECIKAGMGNKVALFLWEPASVAPKNWNSDLHNLFPIIFTWNDNYINDKRFVKIHWPQTRQFPQLPIISFKDKKLLVNISMNKSSHHPRELYSERIATIRHFEKTQPYKFDLYGMMWNSPINVIEKIFPFTCKFYPSYRGTIKNKWDVIPQYLFCLCYENIHSELGGVTEKIFDVMRAGSVPIYWGASNICDYVNADSFIDRRKFKSNSELESYLTNITEKKYNNYITAIQKYLESDKFKKFMPEEFANTIIKALDLTNLK